MTRRLFSSTITLAVVTLGSALGVGAAHQPDLDAGKAAYSENGCSRCHSVETHDIEATIVSERARGRDLSEIGREHDRDWIIGWMKREQTIDGEQHRVAYRGTEDDLQAIAEWLAGLR